MDHGRKIGKSKITYPWDIKFSPPASAADLHPESPKYVNDRKLSNWERWLEIRKKTSEHLMSTINRKNEELVTNSCELIRPRVEMQCLVELASTPYDLKKAESNLTFWKMPEYLRNRKKPSSPEIAVTLTKKKTIPRVGLSKLIQVEKSLDFSKNYHKYGKHNEYLEVRKKQLAPNLSLLQFEEPKFDNLVIKGQGIRKKIKKKEKLLRPPIISISSPEEFDNNLRLVKENHADEVMILRIFDHEIIFNESLFLQQCNKNVEPIMINMTFISMNCEKVEQAIVLENKGVYAIKYQWCPSHLKSNLLSPYIKVTRHFCFNKNPNIILPGQILHLPIWFKPKSPRAYVECWDFNTDPKINPRPIEFRFWGCDFSRKSKQNFSKTDPRSIDEYLDCRIRDREIRVTVDTLVENIFENEEFLRRNPSLFYHPLVIRDMKKLYTEVTEKQVFWSLSLDEFQQLLRKISDSDRRNKILCKFNQYHRKLLMPSFCSYLMRAKYLIVYNLISSFVNGFDTGPEAAKSHFFRSELSREKKIKIQGDVSRSSSASLTSENNRSPREGKRKKNRERSTRSVSSIVPQEISSKIRDSTKTNGFEILAYEIDNSDQNANLFYDRIYKMLSDTIIQICSSIDKINQSNKIVKE